MDVIQQQQKQQSSLLYNPNKSSVTSSSKSKKSHTLSPTLSQLSSLSYVPSPANDNSQPRRSWKTSLSRKLTKLRPKQRQPAEQQKHSFSYTTRNDDITQFGQPRTVVLQELPPLHFNHFLNSSSPPLSPVTTATTSNSLKDLDASEVDEIVPLACEGDATLSPTFIKYNSAVTTKNDVAPNENNNLAASSPAATRPILCTIQNTPSSVHEQGELLTYSAHSSRSNSTRSHSGNRVETPKLRLCDTQKLQTNLSGSTSPVSPTALFRRASDGFSARRPLSFHEDLQQRNQQHHYHFQQQQQQHPWALIESRPTSPASHLTTASASSANSASSSASSLTSWSSASSGTGMPERHPEALRSDWKSLRLSLADASGPRGISEGVETKSSAVADIHAIYTLANEIACHRMRENRTVLQLRQMRAQNRARWAFDSIPKVHIALPLPSAGVPGPAGSQMGPTYEYGAPRRNSFHSTLFSGSEEIEGSAATTGIPAEMSAAGAGRNISRTIDARLGRVNSRVRHKVVSHQVHFPAVVALPPSFSGADLNSASCSSLGEPIIICQTRTARFQLMRTSSSAYLNRMVQASGTILPKGQLMAKLILLNRKNPGSTQGTSHMFRDIDDVPKQSNFSSHLPHQQRQQQYRPQLSMREVSRMGAPASASTMPPRRGRGFGNTVQKRPEQWSLSTDVLTVMPMHATTPQHRQTTSQAHRRASGLRNVTSLGADSPRGSVASLSSSQAPLRLRSFRPRSWSARSATSVRTTENFVSHGNNIAGRTGTASGPKPRHPLHQSMVPEITV